jgi:hypothetical protein
MLRLNIDLAISNHFNIVSVNENLKNKLKFIIYGK